MMKVALAYLHPGTVTFGFHDSVCRVLRDPRYDLIRLAKRSSAAIHHARNAVVGAFLKTKADYLWWVDSDIIFDVDVLERLMGAECPIVSALYFAQDENGHTWPVAMVHADRGFRRLNTAELSPEFHKPIEVAGVGMGCALIQRKVFEDLKMRPLWPYADSIFDGVPVEGDITFCLRAKEQGFGTYVLSDCRVGHVKDRVI